MAEDPRKARLEELRRARAAREAEKSRLATGAASPTLGTDSLGATATGASPTNAGGLSIMTGGAGGIGLTPEELARSQSPSRIPRHRVRITVQNSVAEASFDPATKHDKGSLTNFVYVSDEPPPAPPTKEEEEEAAKEKAAKEKAAKRGAGGDGSPQRRRPVERSAPFLFPPRHGSPTAADQLTRWEASEPRLKHIAASKTFAAFVAKTSLVCARSSREGGPATLDDAVGVSQAEQNDVDMLSVRCNFLDSNGRNVTALCFQPGSSDFLAAAYGEPPGHGGHGFGLGTVHIWSTRSPGAPAFTLECEGNVTALCFSRLHTQVLYGGTQQGKLYKWDLRAGFEPVSCSFPVAECHQSPIVGITVTPATATTEDVATLSSDGRFCTWQGADPVMPTSSIIVTEQSPSCFVLPDADHRQLVIGTSNGALQSVHTVGDQPQTTDIHAKAHAGTVASVECHPPHNNRNLSSLMLTCGLDWHCRIWYPSTAAAASASERRFVSARCDEAALDARWCPNLPAVFACGDAGGRVLLYNAGKSLDAPAAKILAARNNAAVHRVAWDASGRLVAAGCSNGDVVLCAVSNKIAKNSTEDTAGLVQRVTQDS